MSGDGGGLPQGWAWATLDDISESVRNGIYVSRPGSDPDGVPILRISAVRPLRLDLSDLRYSGKRVEELQSADHLVLPGDLLFTRYNGNRELVGACTAVPDSAPALTYPDKLIRVRVNRGIVDPRYVAYAFAWDATRDLVRAHVKTTAGQAGIAGGELKKISIPIPSLAEQRRIAANLEENFSRLSSALNQLSAVKLRLEQLRKVNTMLAVGGRLVATKAEGESGHELRDRALAARAALVRGRRAKPVPFDEKSYLRFPKHWSCVSVDEICSVIEYGSSAKSGQKDSPHDIPVLRMGNIRDGEIDAGRLKYLPTDHPDVAKLLLRDGDLLFNRTNSFDLVGKSAVYRSCLGAMTFASYLIRCRFIPGVEPGWVNLVINSNLGRRYIAAVASQQVGQANVNGSKLAAMPIPLPPAEEQLRILEAVADHRSLIRRAEASVFRAGRQGDFLRRSILAEAFAGRLVPQDPDDEPADALLARIQAERAAAPQRRRGRAAPPQRAASDPPAPTSTPTTPLTGVQTAAFDLEMPSS